MRIATSYVLLLFLAPSVVAAEPKVYRDLPYAEPKNERQTLDVYTPAEGKNHPVVVWIHGGGWHSGDKKDVRQKPQAFTDKGFVFVSINYRLQVWTAPQLSPGVTIKQIAEDVAKPRCLRGPRHRSASRCREGRPGHQGEPPGTHREDGQGH